MNFFSFTLSQAEKQAFRVHLYYSLLEGVILGILALNEFVFIKSMHGSNYMLSFLFQFSVLVFLFLLFFNVWLKQHKNNKRLLIITAWITRLPLLLIAFFPRNPEGFVENQTYHYVFLFVFLMYFLSSPIVNPIINGLLKNAYRHEYFSRLYSAATTANKLVMMLVTFLYGWWLDADNYAFVYVFPITGILGICSIYILSIAHIEVPKVEPKRTNLLVSILQSVFGMRSLLKKNRPFRYFEIGFGFYGFAFMSTVSVMYIFFNQALGLNYSSVAFYRNAYNILAIVFLPFFGKMLGKIDPRIFSIITFSAILLYLFFLIMTSLFPYYFEFSSIRMYYMLLFFILFHAVFAATMSLLWNIGSAYFCKKEEAADYQSVHLFLTGARGIFAPFLGVYFYSLWGFEMCFFIGILALLAGIGVMYWSYKQDQMYQPT